MFFLTKTNSLKDFERQSIDKYFSEKKRINITVSTGEDLLIYWNLVAMATRGITLAGKF